MKKSLFGLNPINKEEWIQQSKKGTEEKREKIEAKGCCSMKVGLLTNASVVDDAIRFVSDRSKEQNLKVYL